MIFTLISFAIFEVKIKVGPYHKFFVPAITSAIWIFIIIPYAVVIPILISALDSTSSGFKLFVRLSMMIGAVILMLLVSTFAIILNVLLQVFLFDYFDVIRK